LASNESFLPDLQYLPIFVARQPIFSPELSVWGYELLFRGGADASTACFDSPDLATSNVIADGFTLAMAGIGQDKKILINFPAGSILDGSPLALPKESCVVEILETVDPTPDVVEALSIIKDQGYTLALDDYVGQDGYEPLIELADIVKVDVLGLSKLELVKTVNRLRNFGVKLLAEKVENSEMFDITRNLGFSFFQGFFFSKPEVLPGRKPPSGAAAKVLLLKELSRPEWEINHIAEIISRDLSFSYRLLKFINSAVFSLKHKVKSLSQAVSLLGQKAFKQWAMVVILSDLDNSKRAEELSYMSIQRARFLELVSQGQPESPHPPDTMFLVGLFSLLDAILNQEMKEIISDTPLDEEIKEALSRVPNRTREWLLMLEAVERGEWSDVGRFLAENKIDPAMAAVHYLKASSWAHEILGISNSAD